MTPLDPAYEAHMWSRFAIMMAFLVVAILLRWGLL